MQKNKFVNFIKKNAVFVGIAVFSLLVIVTAVVDDLSKTFRMVGKYNLAEIVDADGMEMSEDLVVLKENEITNSVLLEKDGNGEFILFNQPYEITWTKNSIVMNGETLPIKWKSGVLSVKDPDGGKSTLVYGKDESGE